MLWTPKQERKVMNSISVESEMQQESVWEGSNSSKSFYSFMDSLIHSPINGTGCLWEEFRIQQSVRKIRFLFSQNEGFKGRQVNTQLPVHGKS